MAGLWNKKFNWKNGEDRICKDCNIPFHTKKPCYTCNLCRNKKIRDYVHKNRPYQAKDKYPFSSLGGEATDRFVDIRRRLRIAWAGGRDTLTEHYSKQLKEIEENGILQWIYDRRDKETMAEKSDKSRNKIIKEYPDTRGHYED